MPITFNEKGLLKEHERSEYYNNGWIDCKAEIVKLIMKDYTKYPDCCDYVNNLLNKIDKI